LPLTRARRYIIRKLMDVGSIKGLQMKRLKPQEQPSSAVKGKDCGKE
jgi:hypothetical protein